MHFSRAKLERMQEKTTARGGMNTTQAAGWAAWAAEWAALWSEHRAPWAPCGGVAQPTNSASAMIGAWVALWIARRVAYTWHNWAILSVILVNLMASCDAHARLDPVSIWVDSRSLLFALWVCFVPLAADAREEPQVRQLALAYTGMTVAVGFLHYEGSFALGLVACAHLLWRRARPWTGRGRRVSVARAVVLLVAATMFWLVDRFVQESVYLLPHSGWHILGAAGVACLCNAV